MYRTLWENGYNYIRQICSLKCTTKWLNGTYVHITSINFIYVYIYTYIHIHSLYVLVHIISWHVSWWQVDGFDPDPSWLHPKNRLNEEVHLNETALVLCENQVLTPFHPLVYTWTVDCLLFSRAFQWKWWGNSPWNLIILKHCGAYTPHPPTCGPHADGRHRTALTEL